MRRYWADILVIGAGGAGLRAALSAHENDPNQNIIVASTDMAGHGGVTATACSDRMAFHVSFDFTPPGGDEAIKEHARDIYVGGRRVSDPELAGTLAWESTNAFSRLLQLGVLFKIGRDGNPLQFLTDGSKYPRACYTGPYTARDIEKALLYGFRERKGPFDLCRPVKKVKFKPFLLLTGLIKNNNESRIIGAIFFDQRTRDWVAIDADAVIIATGGPGSLYDVNVFPEDCYPTPWLAALEAGASLVNLEFIQFGISSTAGKLACSGSLMRALPNITAENRDLLSDVEKIAPVENPIDLLFGKGSSWPVSAESPALPVDIAIWRAVEDGEKVLLDYSTGSELLEKYFHAFKSEFRFNPDNEPETDLNQVFTYGTPFERLYLLNALTFQWFLEREINLRNEPVEVSHAAQHFLGGIHINTRAETGIPGLYACGEVAGGQHGANRPGGNSLLDCQVMGHIAGVEASNFASGVETEPIYSHAEKFISELISKLQAPNGVDPITARDSIKKTLTKNVGAIRVKSRLEEASNELNELVDKGVKIGTNQINDALIARSMQVIGLCIATSALNRDESRGSHVLLESESSNRIVPMREPEGRFLNRVKMVDGKLVFDKIKTESFKKK